MPQIAVRNSGTAAARSIVAGSVAHPVSKKLSESKFVERRRMIEVVLRGSDDAIVAVGEGFEVRTIVARQAIGLELQRCGTDTLVRAGTGRSACATQVVPHAPHHVRVPRLLRRIVEKQRVRADDVSATGDHVLDQRLAIDAATSLRVAFAAVCRHLPDAGAQRRLTPLLTEDPGEFPGGHGNDQLVAEVFEVVGGDGEIVAGKVEITIALRQPALAAKPILRRNAFAKLIDVAALLRVERRRIGDWRLAPWLPARSGVDCAFSKEVIEAVAELVAHFPRGKAADHRMLGVLRWRVRQYCKSSHALEQLLGSVTAPIFTDRGSNAVLVAFQKGCVEIYFFPFFFAGGFFTAVFVVVVAVLAMPSDSDRLSSTSTVWVMASVPVGAGIAAAGGIVCVVCEPPPDFRRVQPAIRSAASIRKRSVFFTPVP